VSDPELSAVLMENTKATQALIAQLGAQTDAISRLAGAVHGLADAIATAASDDPEAGHEHGDSKPVARYADGSLIGG